ncbi:MAG: elongation factor P, partial [Candidatus Omnitrophica bacterium]|nr:elongation factor P [Candidatus Omnitrophota bacterium]
MSISINDIKNGLTVILDGAVFQVISSQHVKPGKGSAFVRTKLRNLKNGMIIERTFKGDEKIEEAFVEEKKLQFLYRKDNFYHFMDQETFEEITFSQDILGENIYFLKENLEVTALVYKGEILNIN